MSSNGKVSALRPRSTASKLFDIFKETQTYDVLGPDGEKFPVVFRSLDYGQNAALAKEMDVMRAAIKYELEGDDLRASLTDQAVRFTREQLFDAVLNLERPLAEEHADLAPGADPDAVEAAKKEAENIKKWEETRRSELEGMEDKDVRMLVVDRQARLIVNSRLLSEFMSASLVHMVIDPEVNDFMFSSDAFECTVCNKRSRDLSVAAAVCCEQPMAPVPNFIGRIAPQVREQLVEFRRQFTAKKDEKAIRKAADSAAFLASGESPNPPDASLGETIETPSSSPPALSPVTPGEPGSTA